MATTQNLMVRMALNESRMEQRALNEQIILRLQNVNDLLTPLIPIINQPTTATNAVVTVGVDGGDSFSVTGAGTLTLTAGTNVTLTATQPSASTVNVEISATGGGSGGGVAFKSPADIKPRPSLGCGSDIARSWTGVETVYHVSRIFAADKDNYGVCQDVPPSSYAGGDVYVRIYFGTRGVITPTGSVIRWRVRIAGMDDGDLFSSAEYGASVDEDTGSIVEETKYHADVGPITPNNPTADQLFFVFGRLYDGVTDAWNGQVDFYGLRIYYDGAP